METTISLMNLSRETPYLEMHLRTIINAIINDHYFDVIDYDQDTIYDTLDLDDYASKQSLRTESNIREEAWHIARLALYLCRLTNKWDFIITIMKAHPFLATAVIFETYTYARLDNDLKYFVETEFIPRVRKAEQDGTLTYCSPFIFCRKLDSSERDCAWTFDKIYEIQKREYEASGFGFY